MSRLRGARLCRPGAKRLWIASGLLGAKAFEGGWETAALGAACHFFIAFSAAAVFYAASRRLTVMTRRAVLSGVLYGVAVYVVMYWIVIPLSNFSRRPFSISAAAIAIITHMVCVGLPISLVVRRYSAETRAAGYGENSNP